MAQPPRKNWPVYAYAGHFTNSDKLQFSDMPSVYSGMRGIIYDPDTGEEAE